MYTITYEENSKNVILQAYSNDENGNMECDYAFVVLTPELINTVKKAQDSIKTLIAGGDSAYTITLWDYRVTWLIRDFFDDESKEGIQGLPPGGVGDIIPVKENLCAEYERWRESVNEDKTVDVFRPECELLHVRVRDFYWECLQKNTSLECTTQCIYLADLEKINV